MRRALLALSLLLLFSCSKEEFSVISLSLSSETAVYIDKDGGRETDEKVFLDGVLEGNEDDSYSFRLSSPDGDLVWEDDFNPPVAIELTPGAVFPLGAYSITVYSTNGTEYSGTVGYHGIPDVAYYTEEGLSKAAFTVELTEDGLETSSGMKDRGSKPSSDAARIVIEEKDGWGSSVTLTQDLI